MTNKFLPKILCPDPESFSSKGKELAKKLSDFDFIKLSQVEFEKRAIFYDALLVRFNYKIDKAIINKKSRVKAILSPTTGLDHINLNLAEKYNVSVFHLKNQNYILNQLNATSELTIALMLTLLRNISNSIESVNTKNWNGGQFRGYELNKKTLGIIGLGRLGRKVAKYADAFGMKVLFYDPYQFNFSKKYQKITNLNQLLNLSDIVSIHVPLRKETINLIGKTEFNFLKNSYLINTSRGKIVNSNALLNALENKTLKGAALDVIDNEHDFILNKKNNLINYSRLNSNLIITPHIGGATFESVEKTDLYILNKYFRSKKII